MNEITRIHLGRQPFTIAVDAHKQLRDYLDAIKEAVGKSHKEVIKEIELRMAELLMERGITEEKTILVEDVTFLKEQLGKPGDFKGDETAGEDSADEADAEQAGQKRLFRDEKRGMLAGVSAGLAAFFNIDPVIVRLAFIVMTIAWGWGILLYIILWIVVPPAKSSSDRLQMRGKAVTVENITEAVNREVTAAASRAGKAGEAMGSLVTASLKILLAIVGVIIATVAVCALFGLAVGAGYTFVHRDGLIQEIMSFPVGAYETIFTIAGFITAGILALWMFLLGSAMIKRKWTVPGWVTASIWGVFLAVAAVGTIVGPDAVSSIRNRYEKAHFSTTRQVSAFNEVEVKGPLSFHYEESDSYKVEIRYFSKQQPKDIVTKTTGQKLTIDATKFDGDTGCENFCISGGGFPEAIIYAPSIDKINIDGQTTLFRIEDGERYRVPGY